MSTLQIAHDLSIYISDATDLVQVTTGRYTKGVNRSDIALAEQRGMYFIKMKDAQLELTKDEAINIGVYFDIEIISEVE